MPQLTQIESTNSTADQAIKKAISRLYERGLKFDDYEIKVYQKGDNLVVIFSDPNRSIGMRGSSGKPGFEVEMMQDLRVLRENFAR